MELEWRPRSDQEFHLSQFYGSQYTDSTSSLTSCTSDGCGSQRRKINARYRHKYRRLKPSQARGNKSHVGISLIQRRCSQLTHLLPLHRRCLQCARATQTPCAVSLVKDSVCSVPLTDVRLPADAAVMLIKKRGRKIIREKKLEAWKTPLAYKTSAKPPKKAPARARKPKVCPNSKADALPAPESAAAELAELSSAELLSPVADAPLPKPE